MQTEVVILIPEYQQLDMWYMPLEGQWNGNRNYNLPWKREYMAAFGAIQELIWIKGVLGEIEFNYIDPITLYMDSKSAISLAKNPTHHKRSKHIEIKYHWLREHTYMKRAQYTQNIVVLKIWLQMC